MTLTTASVKAAPVAAIPESVMLVCEPVPPPPPQPIRLRAKALVRVITNLRVLPFNEWGIGFSRVVFKDEAMVDLHKPFKAINFIMY
jgi:hypothetical protein